MIEMTGKQFIENIDFYNESMPVQVAGKDEPRWTNEQAAWLVERYAELEELREDQNQVKDILQRLVDLKNYKNRYGKDEHYRREQPILWEAAIQILAKPDH